MTTWIGVDGEGIGALPHRYTLMCAATASHELAHVEDLGGLSTRACLDFLLSLPSGRIAGYYLGYDWTMILRDLPDADIYSLLRPESRARPESEGGGFTRVRWRDYRLHFLAGMMQIEAVDSKVVIWDLGKFFQASFLKALDRWGIAAPIAEIEDMKSLRSTFKKSQSLRIKQYCYAECRALASLAATLESALDTADMAPTSWHGPGSVAASVLKRLDIGNRRGEAPEEVLHAADCAFFGGRFEQSSIGTFDGVHGYDIASAYPYAMLALPCLEHGQWEHITSERDLPDPAAQNDAALIHYRLGDIGPQAWGPLPIRMRSGSILYPRSGSSGWIWDREWHSASAGWPGIQWSGDAWVLRGNCDCQVFASCLDMYRLRVAIGKGAKGLAIKLGLNSMYGKLAQSIGHPQYASQIWAGRILSDCRSRLLDLIAMHADRSHVIAVATDGLYTTEEIVLPPMPLDPDTLGSWEHTTPGRVTFVRPGIYWAHDGSTLRARGMGRRKLEEQRCAVLHGIADKASTVSLGTSTLFGGAKACIYRLPDGSFRRSTLYGEWHEVPARISLLPAPKREPDWSPPRVFGVESIPYHAAPTPPTGAVAQKLQELMWGTL